MSPADVKSILKVGIIALKHKFRNPAIEEWSQLAEIARLEVSCRRRYGRADEIQRDIGSVQAIYKICPATAWHQAERTGVYRGSADDTSDGFIHFSTADQLAGTLDKHYRGQTDLKLIAVDAGLLGDALRWEPSRGGDLFPHLYGMLNLVAVVAAHDLPARADGSHAIPELES